MSKKAIIILSACAAALVIMIAVVIKKELELENILGKHEVVHGYIIFPPYNSSPWSGNGTIRYRFKIDNVE